MSFESLARLLVKECILSRKRKNRVINGVLHEAIRNKEGEF